jgi:hypothetical protein
MTTMKKHKRRYPLEKRPMDPGHRSVFWPVFHLLAWPAMLLIMFFQKPNWELSSWLVYSSGCGAWIATKVLELMGVLYWRREERNTIRG